MLSVRRINPRLIISAAQPSATVEEQNLKPGTSVSPARQVFLRGRQWEAPNVDRKQRKQVRLWGEGLPAVQSEALPLPPPLLRGVDSSKQMCLSVSCWETPANRDGTGRNDGLTRCSARGPGFSGQTGQSPVDSWPSTASIG